MRARHVHAPGRLSALLDGVTALLLAVLVHVAAAGLLWLGSLSWQPRTPPPVAAFSLVDAQPFVERRQQEVERAAEQERQRQQALAELEAAERARQLEVQQRQQREREAAERQALIERQQAEQRRREQEAEQQRREEERRALDRQRREAEQQRQRELEDLRRQREQAEAERREQERRLAEIAERRERERADAAAAEQAERLRLARQQAEQSARRATLGEEYQSTIKALVEENWIRWATTRPGIECKLRVVQTTGGWIIEQSIMSPCNADEATRRSILEAVQRVERFPYDGYEEVFAREIEFIFRYDGD
ncbi:MAG: cell envelope integrity protein TolA [Wenzhouxiangellaceae bacterium]|nr:cell envelope integrity protein TolA [Wenzhouxiangellaceae bacterium]